jgi:hypothetical protein
MRPVHLRADIVVLQPGVLQQTGRPNRCTMLSANTHDRLLKAACSEEPDAVRPDEQQPLLQMTHATGCRRLRQLTTVASRFTEPACSACRWSSQPECLIATCVQCENGGTPVRSIGSSQASIAPRPTRIKHVHPVMTVRPRTERTRLGVLVTRSAARSGPRMRLPGRLGSRRAGPAEDWALSHLSGAGAEC